MMIYDDIWWYMMIFEDIWWYMMIYDEAEIISYRAFSCLCDIWFELTSQQVMKFPHEKTLCCDMRIPEIAGDTWKSAHVNFKCASNRRKKQQECASLEKKECCNEIPPQKTRNLWKCQTGVWYAKYCDTLRRQIVSHLLMLC